MHCEGCPYYEKTDGIILIIKLGAIGDVIRTTPLLHKLWQQYPHHAIWWLTYSPAIVPNKVDKILDYNAQSIEIIHATKFDILINLDKDVEAGALTANTQADTKYGFTLENGKPAPLNKLAEHKFITGLFDDVNKENNKSYIEEIFEICGYEFEGEEYILDVEPRDWKFANQNKPIIGLNTGCGARWVSRLLPDDKWIMLIEKLSASGYHPLLLGGKQEHEKNQLFSEKTGAEYSGYFPLQQFISQMNACDGIVSAVTMGMHIAIALKKPLILMNNIFNPHEFELYGRGKIVQPQKECKCFFSPTCTNEEYFCMEHLSVDQIFDAILKSVPLNK